CRFSASIASFKSLTNTEFLVSNAECGRYLDQKDAKIYYESYGEGNPVILLHENEGSISDYYQQIPALAKHFRVIALDTRRQGRSTGLSSADYSYEQFAEGLFEALRELGLDKVSIVGWSVGGIPVWCSICDIPRW